VSITLTLIVASHDSSTGSGDESSCSLRSFRLVSSRHPTASTQPLDPPGSPHSKKQKLLALKNQHNSRLCSAKSSVQVLRPFWKTIVPALRRFAHAAKQTKPASAAEGSLDGGGFPERRTVCTDPAPGTARPPRMGRTPNPALLNPER
jgi:hypothetical protein